MYLEVGNGDLVYGGMGCSQWFEDVGMVSFCLDELAQFFQDGFSMCLDRRISSRISSGDPSKLREEFLGFRVLHEQTEKREQLFNNRVRDCESTVHTRSPRKVEQDGVSENH